MIRSFLLLIWAAALLPAQDFSAGERLQGYAVHGSSAFIIFDPHLYHVQPQRVIVEGSFRNWDHSLTDTSWHLRQKDGLWILPVGGNIAPGSLFKFRIDQGKWLEIPASAENQRDGNLVFQLLQPQLHIEGEIAGQQEIHLLFSNLPENFGYLYHPDNYRLTTYGGKPIAIERIFYLRPGVLQLVPAEPLNIKRVHLLQTPYQKGQILLSFDGWYRKFYSSAELGANYQPQADETVIRIFVPRADDVRVYLYEQPGTAPLEVHTMLEINGLWEIRLPGNREGVFYDFTAHGPDEPGNHFFETINQHFTDPWGRVSVDTFGPCRIWPKMKPARPLKNGIPKAQDIIAYEVHVQDFTRQLPLAAELKGSFRGFRQSGLKNASGRSIGFDHLVELGVNVVHLMPVQEYLHLPDAEWQAAFKDDPYMTEQGINLENYQWGYRTSHAFAIESRYRVKGTDWGSQNADFRDLIEAFHEENIAVIVDVVFNHTAERMDGRLYYFNFSAMDVPYFYRTDRHLDYLGEYGTETKSEERPTMQRWIIEQCQDLIEQYGIDGFRIDIAGQTDQQTLFALREALGPDIIIYGEPWIASADPDYENNPDWDWYKADAPIMFFQDEARNAFKGPTANPENKKTDRGYAGGDGNRERVKQALSANLPEDKTPLSGINYLDIHDNWALADQFAATDWDGRKGVDEAAFKIAATLLFTSVGPVVMHGGTEFMRSKSHAPLQEIVKQTVSGSIFIHGKRDSYNLPLANAFAWGNLGKNRNPEEQVFCNYQAMNDFWKGLIHFRRSEYGKVFRIAERPAPGYYRWIEPQDTRLLGYLVAEQVLVLINTSDSPGRFDIPVLPGKDWRLIANNDGVDFKNGLQAGAESRLKGGKPLSLEVPGWGLRIWIQAQ